MSPGSRADHRAFCERDLWTPVRDARGRAVGHHVTYELPLDDGRILRTRISRPVDTTAYGRGLWHAILTDQLEVTEDEFWACVRRKVRPARSGRPAVDPEAGLPAWLVARLLADLHLPESKVAEMDEATARAALQAHWERRTSDRD